MKDQIYDVQTKIIANAWSQKDQWPSAHFLAALYVLESINGFGPNKFRILLEDGVDPRELIDNPNLFSLQGKIGDKIRDSIKKITKITIDDAYNRAKKQLYIAEKNNASIITYGHSSYPNFLLNSNYPIPVLYVLMGMNFLANLKSVACVGSRKIRLPYNHLHEAFSRTACKNDFAITSGFALGADTIGHKVAYELSAPTICVMPCGLDRPFPPENRPLWQSFIKYEKAVLISEFAFGMSASSLTLRKRNKLIAALAKGVLISQSSAKGGAMNTYRFAREQKKPVATFIGDGNEDTSGNNLITQEIKLADTIFDLTNNEEAFKTWLSKL